MKPVTLLTPGPTPLPPEVLEALSRPIIHHRTAEFGELFAEVLTGLRSVYRTKQAVLMMSCSGTGSMESAVVNLLSPKDPVVVHSTGAFGDRFVSILKTYGIEPVVVSEEWGHAADPNRLKAALRASSGLKAVFLQHTDTSTGVVNDIQELSKCVRENSDALVVLDSISGLGAEPLETDAWGLDVVLAGSQKGLMNAPGLAFAAVSDRGWKLCEAARLPRFYFDWRTMAKSLPELETPYTPAVALVAAQAAALRLILKEGLEKVWARTAEMALHARRRAESLGLVLFAKNPAHILTALRLPEGIDGQDLVARILKEDRIAIAGGQAKLKGKVVRVAHMGFIRKEDVDLGFEALSRRLPALRAS